MTRRKLISNIMALLSGTTIAQALKMITLLLIARQLGVRLYGLYASSIATLTVSAVIFNLGLDTWLLREGGKKSETIYFLFSVVLNIKLFMGIIWFLGVSILFTQLNLATFPPQFVYLSAIIIWLDSILLTLSTLFKATLRNYLASSLMVGNAALLLGSILVLVWLGSVNVFLYMVVQMVVLALSVSVSLILIRQFENWKYFKVDKNIFQQTLRASFPFALSDFLAWLGTRVDVVMVAFILGEYDVGLYSPAVGILSALFFIPAAIYNVVLPVLSNLFANDLPKAIKLTKYTIIALTLTGLSLNIALALTSGLLTYLLGTSYAPTASILKIISLILTFKGVSFAMVAILVAVNWQSQRAFIQAISVCCNIILNLIFLRSFGVMGAAITYIITEAILMIGYSQQVRRYYLSIKFPIQQQNNA